MLSALRCEQPELIAIKSDRRPFNGIFSSMTWVSWHQKG